MISAPHAFETLKLAERLAAVRCAIGIECTVTVAMLYLGVRSPLLAP
jgi:hypothetical protein